MSNIDRVLENLQKEIELYGRSGANSIFKTDVVFTISARAFDVPTGADAEGAIIDFEWFLECANNGRVTAHPNPKRSWWLQQWGQNAEPYGFKWRIDTLKKQFVTELEGERMTAPEAITRLLRLQQIICGWFPTEDKILPNERSQAYVSFLQYGSLKSS